MQFRKYRSGDREFLALEHNGAWVDVSQLPGLQQMGADLVAVLGRWPHWKPQLEQALAAVSTLPAVPDDAIPILPLQPRSLRDYMLCEQHAVDAARGFVRTFIPHLLPITSGFEKLTGKPFPAFKPKPIWYRQPIYYFSNHLNMLTDGELIEWPAYTQYLDYELELAFVIVKPLRNASREQALEAIGGFMVLNDVSARDVQLEEMRSGFGPQKAKHFVNCLSAELTTADEILPLADRLQAEVRINGRVVSATSTGGMQHSLADMLVHASQSETLHPGEVFATGTLAGGCAAETGHWPRPGDELELWIEKVGCLHNRIGAAPNLPPEG